MSKVSVELTGYNVAIKAEKMSEVFGNMQFKHVEFREGKNGRDDSYLVKVLIEKEDDIELLTIATKKELPMDIKKNDFVDFENMEMVIRGRGDKYQDRIGVTFSANYNAESCVKAGGQGAKHTAGQQPKS